MFQIVVLALFRLDSLLVIMILITKLTNVMIKSFSNKHYFELFEITPTHAAPIHSPAWEWLS